MLIFVDSREPKEIALDLKRFFEVSIVTLDSGDIMIPTARGICLIERKTPGDFLSSIADGRLVEQSGKMLKACDAPVIIIEGDIKCNKKGKAVTDGRHTKWRYWSYQGMVLSLQLSGILVLHVPSWLFAETVYRTILWYQKDTHMSKRRVQVGMGTTFSRQVDFLANLPQIGLDKAERLLDKYGCPWDVISTLPDWVEVQGIGKKTVDKVIEFLDFDRRTLESG